MSKITPGKWWIAPPIFDGDAIFAPPQDKGRRNEVVAMGILNRADARLIAAAPELYHMLAYLLGYVREWEAISSGTVYGKKVSRDISKAEILLTCINIEEVSHE